MRFQGGEDVSRYSRRCRRCNEMISLEVLEAEQYPLATRRVSTMLDDIMDEHLLVCGHDLVPEDKDTIIQFYRELKEKQRKAKVQMPIISEFGSYE